MEKFKKLDNYAFKNELEDEMWNVIKERTDYSVNRRSVINGIVNTIFNAASYFNEQYDAIKEVDENPVGLNEFIHDSVQEIFYDAFNSLNGCRMSATDQVIVAQKLTDIILNKATVVGFNGEEYSKFANNYAISDEFIVPDFLKKEYIGLNSYAIDAVVEKARKELGVNPVAAPQNAVVENAVEEPIVEINKEPDSEEASLKAEEEEAKKAKEAEEQATKEAELNLSDEVETEEESADLDLTPMPDEEIEEKLETTEEETKEEETIILLEDHELFENTDDLPSPEEADSKRDFSENL
jgi:hypothetical protein